MNPPIVRVFLNRWRFLPGGFRWLVVVRYPSGRRSRRGGFSLKCDADAFGKELAQMNGAELHVAEG